MLARRIVAKHVTGTTALAMLGATAVLAGQIGRASCRERV